MKIEITPKEIGRRICLLRKNKGLSQHDVSLKVGLSRPAIAQIELGNRNLSALEMYIFSIELGFSLDEFWGEAFNLDSMEDSFSSEKPKQEARVSVPKMNVGKFMNVLLYLVEKCAGKPNVGETVIYKLLYFSDFNYYELYEEHLSGATYRKLPYGPVPKNLDSIINAMIKKSKLQRIITSYHDYPQTRYIPLTKPDLTVLKASEKEVLDKVIAQFSDWSAKSISEYSHKDIPWMASKEGKVINYELAFYREAPYSVRNYNDMA